MATAIASSLILSSLLVGCDHPVPSASDAASKARGFAFLGTRTLFLPRGLGGFSKLSFSICPTLMVPLASSGCLAAGLRRVPQSLSAGARSYWRLHLDRHSGPLWPLWSCRRLASGAALPSDCRLEKGQRRMPYLDEVRQRLREVFDPRLPLDVIAERVSAFVAHEVGKSFWNGVRHAQQKAHRQRSQR